MVTVTGDGRGVATPRRAVLSSTVSAAPQRAYDLLVNSFTGLTSYYCAQMPKTIVFGGARQPAVCLGPRAALNCSEHDHSSTEQRAVSSSLSQSPSVFHRHTPSETSSDST